MLLEISDGWSASVDRGPDWLFVRLYPTNSTFSECATIADKIWEYMSLGMIRRLVVELNEVSALRSHLIGELVRLHKRIVINGGMMRLTGLSDAGYAILQASRLDDRFPRYDSREQAVMGYRPRQPR